MFAFHPGGVGEGVPGERLHLGADRAETMRGRRWAMTGWSP